MNPTEFDHSDALRICTLHKLGAIDLLPSDLAALSNVAGSWAAGISVSARDYNVARSLIEEFGDLKPTASQIDAATGYTAAQRASMKVGFGLLTSKNLIETLKSGGFTLEERLPRGIDLYRAPDRSRLFVRPSGTSAAPAD